MESPERIIPVYIKFNSDFVHTLGKTVYFKSVRRIDYSSLFLPVNAYAHKGSAIVGNLNLYAVIFHPNGNFIGYCAAVKGKSLGKNFSETDFFGEGDKGCPTSHKFYTEISDNKYCFEICRRSERICNFKNIPALFNLR